MKVYGIGIVGCGTVSKAHISAVIQSENAKLIGIYDTDLKKNVTTARELSCYSYSQLEDMLKDNDIDVVVLCTPPGVNRDIIKLAMQHGKNVFVEKPLAVNLADAEDICKYVEDRDEKLSVVSQHLFNPVSLKIKRLIQKESLGRIIAANVWIRWFREDSYYEGTWRNKPELAGGGVLYIQAYHFLHMLLWLLGDYSDIKSFNSSLGHSNLNVEDTATAIISFKSGAIGNFFATTCAYPGFGTRMEIYGSKGSIVYIDGKCEVVTKGGEKSTSLQAAESDSHGKDTTDPGAISVTDVKSQLSNLLEAIEYNSKPKIDCHEAYRVLRFIQSIKNGSNNF